MWDFPSSRINEMTEPEYLKLTEDATPGKVLHGILWFLIGEEKPNLEVDDEKEEYLEDDNSRQKKGWLSNMTRKGLCN